MYNTSPFFFFFFLRTNPLTPTGFFSAWMLEGLHFATPCSSCLYVLVCAMRLCKILCFAEFLLSVPSIIKLSVTSSCKDDLSVRTIRVTPVIIACCHHCHWSRKNLHEKIMFFFYRELFALYVTLCFKILQVTRKQLEGGA